MNIFHFFAWVLVGCGLLILISMVLA